MKQNQTSNVLLCQEFWKSQLDVDVTKYFSVARQATAETKLRNLFFRTLQNIYPTNLFLHRINIKSSPFCSFCNEIDNLIHMFFSCSQLTLFWNMVNSIINKIVNTKVCIQPKVALLGFLKEDIGCSRKRINDANHLILIAKLSIIKYRTSSFKNLDFIFRFELSLRKKFFSYLEFEF